MHHNLNDVDQAFQKCGWKSFLTLDGICWIIDLGHEDFAVIASIVPASEKWLMQTLDGENTTPSEDALVALESLHEVTPNEAIMDVIKTLKVVEPPTEEIRDTVTELRARLVDMG